MQDTGFGRLRLRGAAVFYNAADVGGPPPVPHFPCCGWWGPGIINLWPLWQAVLAWRGFWSVVIGLCLGAVLALGRCIREGQHMSEILVFNCLYQAFDSE